MKKTKPNDPSVPDDAYLPSVALSDFVLGSLTLLASVHSSSSSFLASLGLTLLSVTAFLGVLRFLRVTGTSVHDAGSALCRVAVPPFLASGSLRLAYEKAGFALNRLVYDKLGVVAVFGGFGSIHEGTPWWILAISALVVCTAAAVLQRCGMGRGSVIAVVIATAAAAVSFWFHFDTNDQIGTGDDIVNHSMMEFVNALFAQGMSVITDFMRNNEKAIADRLGFFSLLGAAIVQVFVDNCLPRAVGNAFVKVMGITCIASMILFGESMGVVLGAVVIALADLAIGTSKLDKDRIYSILRVDIFHILMAVANVSIAIGLAGWPKMGSEAPSVNVVM